MRVSLQLRLILVYGTLVSMSLAILGIVGLKGIPGTRVQGWETIIIDEAYNHLNRSADMKASRLLGEIEHYKENLRQIARNPILADFKQQNFSVNSSNLHMYSEYLGASHYAVVDLVSTSNETIVLSNIQERIGTKYTKQAFIRKARINADVGVYKLGPTSEKSELAFVMPVRHNQEDPSLIVVGIINPKKIFYNEIFSFNRFRLEQVDLVQDDGKIFASTDSSMFSLSPLPDLYLAAGQASSGLNIAQLGYGKEFICAYRHIRLSPQVGVGIVVREARSQMLASIWNGTMLNIILVLFSMVIALVVSILVARQFTRPLIQLTKAAKKFAEGNFNVRSQVNQNNEIGELAVAFDEMAFFLDTTLKELRIAKAGADAANQELRETMHELEHLVDTDRLTGAWNRRYFDSMIEREVRRSDRYGLPLSLMIFDVDHFKLVNDTYGHDCGDQVLTEISNRVKTLIRASDALIRWGGEEFLVVSSSTTLGGAVALAEKIRITIDAAPFPFVGAVTVSIGVAQYRQGEDRRDWVQRADKLMYLAKEGGRNRVVSNLPNANKQTPFRLEWQERFVCGNDHIDQQHRELFALLNHLMNSLSQKNGSEIFMLLIPNLIRFVHTHFADEEKAMAEVGFKELAMHKDEHALLLRYIENAEKLLTTKGMHPVDFMEYMIRHVAIGHIIGYDLQYFPLMKKNKNRVDPLNSLP